jgi:hypothetical protein
MLTRLLVPLVATIAIELAVLLFLGERRRQVLYGSVVINMLTNVPLNLYALSVSNGPSTVIVGELLVIVIEMLWYRWLVKDWRQAFIYSLLCNAVSYLTGLLIQMIFMHLTLY